MAILTNVCERLFLDHVFGVTEWNRPTNLYLGVSATAFTEADTAFAALQKEAGSSSTTVFNANSYARVKIAQSGSSGNTKMVQHTSTQSSGASSFKNTNGAGQIDFPQASGSGWGAIQYWAIFQSDIPSNSTTESTINADANQAPLMFGSFSSATTVASGSQFRISEGDFEIIPPSNIVENVFNAEGEWAGLLGLTWNNDWTFKTASTGDHYRWWLGISTSEYAFNETVGSHQEPGFSSTSSQLNNGYIQRAEVIMGAASTSTNNTTSSNTSAIVFPECQTNNWGDIAYWALYQGGSSGSGQNPKTAGTNNAQTMPIFKGALSVAKTVTVGDVLRFPIGSFVIGAT